MKFSKEILIEQLKNKIQEVTRIISTDAERIGQTTFKSIVEINKMRKGEREHAMHLKSLALVRHSELETLQKSPFFSRCKISHKSVDVRLRGEKDIYFAKHEFSEQNIYSWIAPIASIRFAEPGTTSFKLPNGKMKEVEIKEKDQYLIVDGKVVFFAQENIGEPRELIYQEHFSLKKGAFMLPEIVEVMEKAQDDVIRASHFGPFSISGPAGSGKTTLALHRVAYLAQSPETIELYQPELIIVFVQDTGTKEYFTHLLPELGIHNVRITTFFEWAQEILSLEDCTFVQNTECELEKLLLRDMPVVWKRDVFQTLDALYSTHGSEELQRAFIKQKRDRVLDRIDVTLALQAFKQSKGKLHIHIETNRAMRMGRIVRHKVDVLVEYSLVIVDEFQNYMPEQLKLLKSCIKENTQSIIYVGDMSQKIQHGTIREWNDFNESITPERQIKLHKVYRNTKQILRYINTLGYNVEIPDGLKEGPEVAEYQLDLKQSVEKLKEIVSLHGKDKSVGILSFDSKDLKTYKGEFKDNSFVKVLTIAEAQGVEFDIVCIVGIHKDMFPLTIPTEFIGERKQIYKDKMYIALTRAISGMHVFGECSLKEVL